MKARSVFLCLLSFAALDIHHVVALEEQGQRPEVTLGGTRIVGVRDEGLDVEFFGGIPFAEPPIGALRFRPPVLKTALNCSEFDASTSGLACLQTDLAPNAVTEDCLTLNIFRPSITNGGGYNGESLPVLFWIHGGAWVIGSAGRYNGSRLVSQSIARGTPVLFVAANYRLGPLGFPLGEEAAGAGVLNLGLQDNLAALRWVKANIEAFGGDPSKVLSTTILARLKYEHKGASLQVTVSGESAGARSIDLLLFHEQINDLASGAIIESDPGVSILDPPLTNQNWSSFVGAVVPCSQAAGTRNTLECLRGKNVSTDDLLKAFNTEGVAFVASVTWGPVVADGELMKVTIFHANASLLTVESVVDSRFNNSGTLFVPQTPLPANVSLDDEVRSLIQSTAHRPPGREEEIEQILDRVLEAYPNIPSLGSPFGTGNETFGLDPGYKRVSAIAGDFEFQSHRRFMLQRFARRPQVPVYSYLFADSNGGVPTVPPEFIIGSPAPGSLGVAHASEIFYLFGTLKDELGPGKVATTASELSRTIMDYWISFAVSRDPNDGRGAARPRWTPFDPTDPMIIQLKGGDTRMISDTFREQGISVFNEDPTALRR
ncbi:hypothetical protein V5O48_012623 [Marasmius crinis-equi]|uniref:Carboxylesterase type B domain-containing protein n=1 Tax=Marasmius crinis-equi TaxID=585013 RepID=A0ABR3F2A1_9AGAR